METGGVKGIWRELRQIGRRGRQVWRLVPWRHRWALGSALVIMCLASAGNTAMAVFLGKLVDSVDPAGHAGSLARASAGSARSTWGSSAWRTWSASR